MVFAASFSVQAQSFDLVGTSAPMLALRAMIARVAPSEFPVLITGETGTGKELVARALHAASPRSHLPFIAVNCGAIPHDLMESELFGHERGAFTGAHASRIGRFEAVGEGTLFLDEIGDLPMPMQAKLLRVLQERTFERLGDNTPRQLRARIVAATHRDLPQRVNEGHFREDLYYRLSVIPIEVPPLRDRPEDICLLAKHAMHQSRVEAANDAFPVRFDPGVCDAMMTYAWPGNVRELFNLSRRLSVFHPGGTVRIDDLPGSIRRIRQADRPQRSSAEVSPAMGMTPVAMTTAGSTSKVSLKTHLERVERDIISRALKENFGVIAWAADSLGMRRTTLIDRMSRLGIERPESHLRKTSFLPYGRKLVL